MYLLYLMKYVCPMLSKCDEERKSHQQITEFMSYCNLYTLMLNPGSVQHILQQCIVVLV